MLDITGQGFPKRPCTVLLLSLQAEVSTQFEWSRYWWNLQSIDEGAVRLAVARTALAFPLGAVAAAHLRGELVEVRVLLAGRAPGLGDEIAEDVCGRHSETFARGTVLIADRIHTYVSPHFMLTSD